MCLNTFKEPSISSHNTIVILEVMGLTLKSLCQYADLSVITEPLTPTLQD